MSAFSDYYENKIIDHMMRNQAFTPPATVYLALFTSVTGLEANSGITGEVSGGSYARQAVTLAAPSPAGVTSNSADITFPAATASWGTVTHVALVDHATNATWGSNVNVLMFGALTAQKIIGQDDTFQILAGDLDMTVS
jgi:hypothetical protein